MKERMTRSIRNFRNYFRHSEFVLFLFLFSFLYLFLTQFLVKLKFRRNVKKEEEGRKDRAELCDTEGRKGRGASGKKKGTMRKTEGGGEGETDREVPRPKGRRGRDRRQKHRRHVGQKSLARARGKFARQLFILKYARAGMYEHGECACMRSSKSIEGADG